MTDPKYENIGDIITLTIEECSELIHILCKVKRFGWYCHSPKDDNKTPNFTLVKNEISDLEKRIAQLKEEIPSELPVDYDDNNVKDDRIIKIEEIEDDDSFSKLDDDTRGLITE